MSKKALVVDNDFFFVEFMTELLEKREYEIIKAYDGKEAITKLEEGPVDFLFLDIIMPKIDGKQVIEYTRKKFSETPFPIIAMSGAFVEQREDIDNIGADYYIAKGPMEEMGVKINDFLDRVENQSFAPLPGENILEQANLAPRELTDELMDGLNFKRAIIESVGVGIIVLDKDVRILSANSQSLYMMNKPLEKLLNRHIIELFPKSEKGKLIGSLKKVILNQELRRVTTTLVTDYGEIRTIVSTLRIDDEIAGWIIALEKEAQEEIILDDNSDQ